MARGWESKSVEAQQEEASRTRSVKGPTTAEDRARADRRRTLELARARARDDLSRAKNPAHRQMLQQTLDAIAAQLEELQPKG